MSAIEEVLARNARAAEQWSAGALPAAPALRLAVVACMDARMDIHRVLGLADGEAHVIRNAGGAVTPDTIRSLAVSQRMLGTREVILVHHSGCGMHGLSEDDFRAAVERETGVRPDWALEAFTDLDADVRQSMARIRSSPFIPHTDALRGFVLELGTGRLREVAP